MKNMNYEKMFEKVANKIEQEIIWTVEGLEVDPTDERMIGMLLAYRSIMELINKMKEKGYDEYVKECDEVVKKYEHLMKEGE